MDKLVLPQSHMVKRKSSPRVEPQQNATPVAIPTARLQRTHGPLVSATQKINTDVPISLSNPPVVAAKTKVMDKENLVIMEAKLSTTDAFNKVFAAKNGKVSGHALTASSANAKISEIMCNEDMDVKEAALIELARFFNATLVNCCGHVPYEIVVTAITSVPSGESVLNSGASTNFVTSDNYLTKPHKHKTTCPIIPNKNQDALNISTSASKSSLLCSRPSLLPSTPWCAAGVTFQYCSQRKLAQQVRAIGMRCISITAWTHFTHTGPAVNVRVRTYFACCRSGHREAPLRKNHAATMYGLGVCPEVCIPCAFKR